MKKTSYFLSERQHVCGSEELVETATTEEKLLKIKVIFNREKFKIPARSLLGLVIKFCGDLKKKLIKVIKTNSVSLYRESNSLTPVRYKGS